MTPESRLSVSLSGSLPLGDTLHVLLSIYCALTIFPDSILKSLKAKARLLLLHPPPVHSGVPPKIALGPGREATMTSRSPPGDPLSYEPHQLATGGLSAVKALLFML